jgi:hypothetical protein
LQKDADLKVSPSQTNNFTLTVGTGLGCEVGGYEGSGIGKKINFCSGNNSFNNSFVKERLVLGEDVEEGGKGSCSNLFKEIVFSDKKSKVDKTFAGGDTGYFGVGELGTYQLVKKSASKRSAEKNEYHSEEMDIISRIARKNFRPQYLKKFIAKPIGCEVLVPRAPTLNAKPRKPTHKNLEQKSYNNLTLTQQAN